MVQLLCRHDLGLFFRMLLPSSGEVQVGLHPLYRGHWHNTKL